MRSMASGQVVLTLKEICEMLRVNPTTVYKMVRQGRIPAFRVGSDWRFRADEIVHWMAENTKGVPQ
jgi:excisionase family DNA binding protein